jgi:hypothetical protein
MSLAARPTASRGGDGPVRPHLEGELLVVGLLADAGVGDRIVDLLDRRVDRVNRDPADAEVLVEAMTGGTTRRHGVLAAARSVLRGGDGIDPSVSRYHQGLAG